LEWAIGKAIGMGYVKSSNAGIGSEINIWIRNSPVKAKIVKLPFA